MPLFVAAVTAAAGIGSSVYQGVNNANAADKASKAQQQAAAAAAANYAPYLGAGQAALSQQMALLGLGNGQPGNFGQPNYAAYVTGNPDILAAYQRGDGKGASIEDFGKWHWTTFGQNEAASGDPNRTLTPYGPAGQQGGGGPGSTSAIDALKNTPLYQSLYHNGEQSVLANAAATGGLRGGNAQRSLYNLGTDTLGQVYQNQLQNLGALSSLGESAAAGSGNYLTQGAAAQAGGILGSANANNQLASTIAGIPSVFGNQQVLNGLGLGGGIKSTTQSPLANFPSIAANASTPLNLDTNIPMPVF